MRTMDRGRFRRLCNSSPIARSRTDAKRGERSLLDALTSRPRRLVASWLLHTELHCAAGRHPEAVGLESIALLLNTIDLVDLTRGDMIAGGTHAQLRSNDAIHLAVAIRLGVDEFVTYDTELARAARNAGLAVVTPG
ncbi:type II toxin-antitoxin system VapC family toxin (plasmid) [Coraliomargarita sp. W4R53]